jgi:hypothetical protein
MAMSLGFATGHDQVIDQAYRSIVGLAVGAAPLLMAYGVLSGSLIACRLARPTERPG